ncbi:MAG TPA: branched-chain amino acid ABC transporter substrate-binding protein [Acidimicrobiales bacterium]|jgi:branched-chain amino acid transport system substrate-binding protein|nr:branched-chain amino acid ABC transporter substrate-binding protein [Acidimicrobiales bacterium]
MKLRLSKAAVVTSVGALLAAGVPLVGLASSGASAAGKPTYTIGVEGPFSGSDANYGDYIYGGVELAINAANASGKYHFTLKPEKFDDQGSSSLSPAAAQKATGTKNLIAVVGPAFSGASEAAAPYYLKAHVAEVSASATAVALASGSSSNFMRTIADDSVQGKADADYLVKVKSVSNLLVISDASFYGDGLAKVVAADATALGAKVTTETIPNVDTGGGGTTTEYAPAATAIATSDPGAIFYGGYSPDFGLLLSALSGAGYTASAHVIMSGDGSNSPSLITSTSPASAANGVFLSEGAAGKVNFLTGKLASSYFKLTKIKASVAEYAAQAYDATNAIIAALVKTKTPATVTTALRKEIVTNLHKVNFKGITGTIAFAGDGDLRNDTGTSAISEVESGTITFLVNEG